MRQKMLNSAEWIFYKLDHSMEECEQLASSYHCTMCGKPFTVPDVDRMMHKRMHFYCDKPSKYADNEILFLFCPACFDRFLDTVIPMCSEDPVIEEDYTAFLGEGLIPE